MDRLVDSFTDNKIILQKRDEMDTFEQPFENKKEINELSLVVIQTKKNVFLFVVPSENFDENLSAQLVKEFPGRNWTETEDYPQKASIEFNKISFIRLGENRKHDSNFSKSIDS